MSNMLNILERQIYYPVTCKMGVCERFFQTRKYLPWDGRAAEAVFLIKNKQTSSKPFGLRTCTGRELLPARRPGHHCLTTLKPSGLVSQQPFWPAYSFATGSQTPRYPLSPRASPRWSGTCPGWHHPPHAHPHPSQLCVPQNSQSAILSISPDTLRFLVLTGASSPEAQLFLQPLRERPLPLPQSPGQGSVPWTGRLAD